MVEIKFLEEATKQEFIMLHDKSQKVLEDIRIWAAANAFEYVAFWRDAEDAQKLWVQLGQDKLNYWIHESTFTEGKHETVEMQMDYARGAQRRVVAGYGKFDK